MYRRTKKNQNRQVLPHRTNRVACPPAIRTWSHQSLVAPLTSDVFYINSQNRKGGDATMQMLCRNRQIIGVAWSYNASLMFHVFCIRVAYVLVMS